MTVQNTLWVDSIAPTVQMGQTIMTHMEDTLHYIGGLLDGEGSFQISVGKEKRTPLGYRARPKVELWMKREDGREDEIRKNLEEVAERAGVSYRSKEVDRASDDYECWVFAVYGHTNVVPFIEEVRPYLRLKENHADLLLEPDWQGANSDESSFMEVMRVRDRLREISANRGSKYDTEYFEEEFNL